MISIIIPNYNGEAIIGKCLESIMMQNYQHYEVIIVDNNSIDNSLEIIKNFPVNLIINRKNEGFAKAVNQGIKAARFDYVFLLNSDVILHQDNLIVLLEKIENNIQLFSVQPRMLQYYNDQIIDDAGDIYTIFGLPFQLGHGVNKKYYQLNQETFSCCAGAALYRKSIFDKIGYFDERYFAYLEDVDIGFRARRNGYRNWITSDTEVKHIGSASFGKKATPFKAELAGKNYILTLMNNMPLWMFLVLLVPIGLGILMNLIRYMLKGMVKSYWKGLLMGIKMGWMDLLSNRTKKEDLHILIQMFKNTLKFIIWRFRRSLLTKGR